MPDPTGSVEHDLIVFDAALGYLHRVLRGAAGVPLDRPTGCARWRLPALLAHVADSLAVFADLLSTARPAPPVMTFVAGSAGVAEVEIQLRRLVAARRGFTADDCAVHERTVCPRTVFRLAALEVGVHGWDVAVAADPCAQLPATLARRMHDIAAGVIDDGNRHPQFAPAVPVAERATDGVRLLGFLGRRYPGSPADVLR